MWICNKRLGERKSRNSLSIHSTNKKIGISIAMDDTENDILYDADNKVEDEADSPDLDCDPYDETVHDDVYDEIFASNVVDYSNFEMF